jgi:hypothetical protein
VALDASSWRVRFIDSEFQRGLRWAVFSPFVTYLAGVLVVMVRNLSAEYALSWSVLHVVGFGVLQLVWLLPMAAFSGFRGRARFAHGLLAGGGVLLVSNAFAWALGLWIGAS